MEPTVPLMIGLAGGFILLGLFVQAAFLLMGARVSGIEDRSFGKAIGAVILGGVASAIASFALGFIPAHGELIAGIGSFIVTVLITQAIFSTTFGKALVAEILSWVFAILIVGGIAVAVFIGLGLSLPWAAT